MFIIRTITFIGGMLALISVWLSGFTVTHSFGISHNAKDSILRSMGDSNSDKVDESLEDGVYLTWDTNNTLQLVIAYSTIAIDNVSPYMEDNKSYQCIHVNKPYTDNDDMELVANATEDTKVEYAVIKYKKGYYYHIAYNDSLSDFNGNGKLTVVKEGVVQVYPFKKVASKESIIIHTGTI